MTEVSKGMRTLPLQGSPGRSRGWLIALTLGIPALVMVGIVVTAAAHDAPLAPLLPAGALVLAISAFATFWIDRMIRRISVALDADGLLVNAGIVARRFPFSTLRAGGVRTVSLREHVELKPVLRTWGIGMPGLASGWFRLRNGAKALCILTGRDHVTSLRSEDGICILLSLADPAPIRSAFERAE
jgi:hypothetical protein